MTTRWRRTRTWSEHDHRTDWRTSPPPISTSRREARRSARGLRQSGGLPKTKADGLAGLAEIAYEKDDLEGAIKHYQEALQARPKDPRFVTALREISTQLEIRRQQAAVATGD